MTAMMICLGGLPMAMSLSAKVLTSGLKTLAFIAGKKRARLDGAEPIFVIGVRERPEVLLTKCLGGRVTVSSEQIHWIYDAART